MPKMHTAIPAGRLGLRGDSHHLELLTIQHADVADALERDAVVYPDADRAGHGDDPVFADAYRWMSRQLSTHTHPTIPFDADAGSMFWLWAQTTREALAAQARAAAQTEPSVLLRVRMRRNRVLLSDFDAWHGVLNRHTVLSEDQLAELERAVERDVHYQTPFEQTLEVSYGASWRYESLDEATAAAVRDTWQHCLVERPRRGAHTQACVTHLEKDDVIDIVHL